MECLVNSVSPYYGCGAPTPISGMYLSNLPGIEFANIDGIANQDQITWSGLWDDLQTTAKNCFKQDVIAEFGNRYMLKQTTQTIDLGKVINTTNITLPAANTTNGLLLEMMEQGGQCIGSNLMGIYIQSINYYWNGTAGTPTLTLTFKDADLLNDELIINPTNVVQGWNTFWVDFSFAAKRLYVLASGNFDNSVQLDLSLFNTDNFGGYTWGNSFQYLMYNYGTCGTQTRINGCTYNSSTNTAIKGMNTYGMSAVMSTNCTWDAVVCNNKRQFFIAWQHCLAIELLNYRINSSRLNRWTSIDKKQAVELQRLFTIKYRGGQNESVTYDGILRQSIESTNINTGDGCIRANNFLIHRENRM